MKNKIREYVEIELLDARTLRSNKIIDTIDLLWYNHNIHNIKMMENIVNLNSQEIYDLANSPEIQDFIQENLYDPWVGTPFEGYRYMDNKQKGELGERFVSLIFRKCGYDVGFAHTSTAGYDRVINGIRTEIKFSLSHTNNKKRLLKEDCFTMNHVAVGKNWERLILLAINGDPNKVRAMYMTKEDFKQALATGDYFNHQQGGNSSDNDDYMIASTKIINLMKSRFMKELKEW
jgi:hypothetical protein